MILPTLLSIETPGKNPVWSHFSVLKAARNSTIHMKAADAYVISESAAHNLDKESLFHQFFNRKTMKTFPMFAIEVIAHLRRPDETPPRWLSALQAGVAP